MQRVAFTVDLEDWVQSVYDRRRALTDRFVRSTERLCGLLDEAGVRGTFFVLGLAARHAPELIRRLHETGHEIQSHGYDHTPVTEMSPRLFQEDVRRAKAIVEDIIQHPVTAYRAPEFSIVRRTLWALDLLAEQGFEVDSSIVPGRIRHYGIRGWPTGAARVSTSKGGSILEIPVTTWALGAKRIPMGGGYARLLPGPMLRAGLTRGGAEGGVGGVFYCHPYELDRSAFRELNIPVNLKTRLHQGLGRAGFAGKLRRLLRCFRFCRLSDIACGAIAARVTLHSDHHFTIRRTTSESAALPGPETSSPLPA